ncbi:MAG: substrate-binding domain-containing protein, partial [Oscillospiraceae bacterium]
HSPEKKPNGILLINVPSFENPFYSEIIKGARSSAIMHGFYLLISQGSLDSNYIEHIAELVKSSNVVGMIVLDYLPDSLLLNLDQILPVVQCCEYNKNCDIPYVGIDNLSAAINVMDYILSIGRRRIALINGPRKFMYARDRHSGYEQSLTSRNISVPRSWDIQLSEVNFDMAYTAACQLFSCENKPNAVFAVSDVFAAAVIKAANRYGLSVPDDVAVVGFDNIDVSMMSSPTITTVNQPKFQLGYTACEFLVDRINRPENQSNTILLNTELIVRESSSIDKR